MVEKELYPQQITEVDVEYALAQKLEIFDFHVCATPLSSTAPSLGRRVIRISWNIRQRNYLAV